MQSTLDFNAPYPVGPGFAKNSDTSKEAAAKLTGRETSQEHILTILRDCPAGLIVDEIKPILEDMMERPFDRSTVAARCTELERAGKISLSEEKRKTPMNRFAHVYKIV